MSAKLFNTNLDHSVSMPVREIHEVEFSSRCNLACRYCPHPKMARPKADMTEETFALVLAHVRYLCVTGTQGEVSMTGIGEAIMHPQFVPWMRHLRETIGAARKLVLATNGVAMTPELAREISAAGCITYVSTHRPEKAGPALEMLRSAGCIIGTNTAFVDSAMNWAGQVEWFVSAKPALCSYLGKSWCAVRQDGSVDACCMDAEDLYPIGHVADPLGSLRVRAVKLCEACHMVAPREFRVGQRWPDEPA